MVMTPDQERWAEALWVERMHGAGAVAHVAERLGTLCAEGDDAGVERWREISRCLDQLLARGARA